MKRSLGLLLALLLLSESLPATEQATNGNPNSAAAQDQAQEQLEEQPQLPRSPELQAKYDLIQEVLSDDDFGVETEEQGWRLKDWRDKQQRDEKFPDWLIWLIEILESDNQGLVLFSQVVEVLLWGGLIALLVFIVCRYRERIGWLYQSLRDKPVDKILPSTMFGMELTVDDLPDDVVAAARQRWQRGEHRAALSVLLRASLVKLLERYHCEFFSSDTEQEVCQRVDATAPALQSSYLRELVSVWQLLAYAHQVPTQARFSALCDQWSEVF